MATAHPAKFEQVVEPLIGTTVPVPAALDSLLATSRERRTARPRVPGIAAHDAGHLTQHVCATALVRI